MLRRRIDASIRTSLRRFRVVGLIGSRQSGKTTLAKALFARRRSSLYLDLERSSDRTRLSDPELYLSEHPGKSIVLDEIQRMPEIFPVLRVLADAASSPGRQVLATVDGRADPYFYRTHSGAEVDLVLARGGTPALALEFKLGLTPTITRGLREAVRDLGDVPCFVVYPGAETYSLAPGFKALPVSALAESCLVD